MAYVNVSDVGDSSVRDIRTVKDFSDIFPEVLPGLPLEREVEFGIELFSGTAPLSIAPYRMAPKELVKLKAQIQELLDHDGGLLAVLQVKPVWMKQIKSKQLEDESLGLRFRHIENGNTVDFGLNSEGVKAEHQLPSGLLQSVKIPLWKWERVTMDFVSGLYLTPSKKDSVWVIVDRLTKTAHFVPVRTNYSLKKVAKLYVSEIVRLHGVPVSIISERDHRFTSRFWKKLHEALGTRLDFSIAFHH
ncbi:uncharacterized protein LOC108487752 [Gossypium arboreum]|uniref:uncharacterized protein LOC108487752 n=1 Tax=Gossypium arboreum TaxID=29729 RepID=UPI00081948E7|nr:uncharacterized protein LOC108487752 [Gossypium arboreum]